MLIFCRCLVLLGLGGGGVRAAFCLFCFEILRKMSVLRFNEKSVACNVLFFSVYLFLLIECDR